MQQEPPRSGRLLRWALGLVLAGTLLVDHGAGASSCARFFTTLELVDVTEDGVGVPTTGNYAVQVSINSRPDGISLTAKQGLPGESPNGGFRATTWRESYHVAPAAAAP